MAIMCFPMGNTREGGDDCRDLSARNLLLQRLLDPPAAKEARFCQQESEKPGRGKYGVSFRRDETSLFDVRILEVLGSGTVETPASGLELTARMKALVRTCQRNSSLPHTVGADDCVLQHVTEKDFTRIIEAVLSTFFLTMMRPLNGVRAEPETEKVLEVLPTTSNQKVASDLHVRPEVAAGNSVEAVISRLKGRIPACFEQLIPSKDPPQPDRRLQALGPEWSEELKNRSGELFDRARGAPGGAATLPAFQLFREDLLSNILRSAGDVFVYLKERDSGAGPVLIIATILEALAQAHRRHHNEPPIVLIHSMGSTILSDTQAHNAPDVQADDWVSAASPVGQCEEMKRFKASGKNMVTLTLSGVQREFAPGAASLPPADVLGCISARVFAD